MVLMIFIWIIILIGVMKLIAQLIVLTNHPYFLMIVVDGLITWIGFTYKTQQAWVLVLILVSLFDIILVVVASKTNYIYQQSNHFVQSQKRDEQEFEEWGE